MDVMLIAATEKNVSSSNIFREITLREDKKNLELNPLFNGFINRYRENLGIACLASYLRQFDFNVQIINASIENKANAQIVEEIFKNNPILIGFSVLYELHLYNTLEIIFNLRNIGYSGHITIGGPGASFIYEFLLKSDIGIDSIIVGEGEMAIYKLIQCLQNRNDWTFIEGIAYCQNGQVYYNQKTNLFIENLSELPFAARDSLYYLKNQGYKVRTASIYSSRGCMGNCIYCTAPASSRLEPQRWRCRSGESIYNETEFLVKEFNIEYLYFCDVNFIGYGSHARERLEVFCKNIIDNNIKINFHAEIRVDSLEPDLLKLLKKAGMRDVLLGIESGSQRLLNTWKKGVTVQKNKLGIKKIKEHGFLLEPAMIMVSALTTRQDLIETIDFIIETEIYKDNIPMHMFNKMCVFRGSEAEKKLREKGIITQPDIDVITKSIKTVEDVLLLSQELLSREYKIVDKNVEIVWETVITYINKLTWLIQDYFPDYLSSQFRQFRRTKQKSSMQSFISVRQWRAGIDILIKDILLLMKKYLEKEDVYADDLDFDLSSMMKNYEEKHLGYVL